jgi:hypothetical protein
MVDVIIDYEEIGWILRRSNQEDCSIFLKQDGFKWALRCAKKIVRHEGYRGIVITPAAAKELEI